jgi:hypothetical protein
MNTGGGKYSMPFRLSGVLLIIGLCIEVISLFWIHPLAFISFFVIGGVFLGAGVLLYLSSIIFHPSPTNPNDSRSK